MTQKITKKKLTFIIVTYNSSKIIESNLQRLDFDKYNVIISDNNSSDNTLKIIKDKFPKAKIIENDRNLGFPRANNIAFEEVNTEFTCLLNPDCFFEDETIEKILEICEKNPQIAIANAVSYDGLYDKNNSKLTKGEPCIISQNNYQQEADDFYLTKFISGCFMILQTDIFKKIGLFDNEFFMYCEDNEICKRAVKNGYEIATIKNTTQIHLSGQSSGEFKQKTRYGILWHKNGWSKCHYTSLRHGKLIGKLKAIRNIIKLSILILIEIVQFKKINIRKKATLDGCFSYLIGIKAFDKNDNPRKLI
ncbi:glycosyltransferase family 2 protein [Rickettsiales bacterium]|nr:glycosyltransferase family 2 protein [Rickettsiales bacterium]